LLDLCPLKKKDKMIKTTQHLYESATAASCRRTATTECGGIFSLFTTPTLIIRRLRHYVALKHKALKVFSQRAQGVSFMLFLVKNNHTSHTIHSSDKGRKDYSLCALRFLLYPAC
jgi:hypothetical protein